MSDQKTIFEHQNQKSMFYDHYEKVYVGIGCQMFVLLERVLVLLE